MSGLITIDTLFLKVNELEDPIIASRIRINPIRWNHHISMRVEIKGCIFNAYTAHFTGDFSSDLLHHGMFVLLQAGVR